MGCDGISPRLRKHCALPLCQPLLHLFTLTCQFGFLRSRSSLQQLLILFHNIDNSLKKIKSNRCSLFKKAFDSVAHSELFYKLWSFGITGKLWLWIKAYLSDRLQCVSINNIHSDVMPVISGLPQGSILRPLLFLIFVNDLPASVMSSTVLLFADDAKCKYQPTLIVFSPG